MPPNKKKKVVIHKKKEVVVVPRPAPVRKRLAVKSRSRVPSPYDDYYYAACFPESSPPTCIPDADDTDSVAIKVVQEVGVVTAADSGVATDAYGGIVVYCQSNSASPTGAYKTLASTASGAFTWGAATSLDRQSDIKNNFSYSRLVGMSLKIENLNTLSTMGGEYASQQYNQSVTAAATVVADPVSWTEHIQSGAAIISAADIDNAGFRRAAIPLYANGNPPAFSVTTTACSTASALVVVWKGAAQALGVAALQSLRATITFIYEVTPLRSLQFMFPVMKTIGDSAQCVRVSRSIAEMIAASGTTVAGAARALASIGGSHKPKRAKPYTNVLPEPVDQVEWAKGVIESVFRACGPEKSRRALQALQNDFSTCFLVDVEFDDGVVQVPRPASARAGTALPLPLVLSAKK